MPARVVDDAVIAATTIALIDARSAGTSICPSDVARTLEASEEDWRALMPRVRQVAERLAREGRLQATRRGFVVDATSPGGPIRLIRRPAPPDGVHSGTPDGDPPASD